MKRHLPWLIATVLLAVTVLVGYAMIIPCSQQQEPLIVGVNNLDPDPDDENILPDELSEQMFRQSTMSGSNWQILSSMRLGSHETYTWLPEVENMTVDPYLALGTYERDPDGVTVVAAGIASLRSDSEAPNPEVHTAFGSLVESPRSVDRGPVVASLHAGILGDLDYWACFVFGWTDDADVAEFTLRFSTGGEITLDAQTHEFFVGLVGKTPRDPDDQERDIEARDRIWGIEITAITAYDEDGNTIDDRTLWVGFNPDPHPGT